MLLVEDTGSFAISSKSVNVAGLRGVALLAFQGSCVLSQVNAPVPNKVPRRRLVSTNWPKRRRRGALWPSGSAGLGVVDLRRIAYLEKRS